MIIQEQRRYLCSRTPCGPPGTGPRRPSLAEYVSRSGADLALLLLGGFRTLVDTAIVELARRGYEDGAADR
jgi:hypothetical protein